MWIDIMFYKSEKSVYDIGDEFIRDENLIGHICGRIALGVYSNIEDYDLLDREDLAEIGEFEKEVFNLSILDYDLQEIEILKDMSIKCYKTFEDGYYVYALISL